MTVSPEELRSADKDYHAKPPEQLIVAGISLVIVLVAVFVWRLSRRVMQSERRLDAAENETLARDCLEHAKRFDALALAARQAGDVAQAEKDETSARAQRRMAESFRRRRH